MSADLSTEPSFAPARSAVPRAADATTFSIILALSFSHFLNDMIQSLVPALYPMLKGTYGLSFAQIGMITLTMQMTSSILQPVVGAIADKRPQPYSLPVGMGATLTGLLLLAHASSFPLLLLSASMVGAGSAVFHPEASRVARMASGGRHGLAQSLFQVGGNVGSATGPILAAFIIIPKGQGSITWFSGAALLAMAVLIAVGNWHWRERAAGPARGRAISGAAAPNLSRRRVAWSVVILLTLVFSKSFYTTSLNSYYTFYLMNKFGLSIREGQVYLFVFLASVALGTLIGGPVGDRIGRKWVIWGSILGVIPFTLALPHVGLAWTGIFSVLIGLTMASASSAIVVYAIDLMPGKVGTVAGLFFGLSFGLGGVGAAALGRLADATSITFVYQVCAFLPLLGLLTIFLPDVGRIARPRPPLRKPPVDAPVPTPA
ncbi:MAG TPA: MFS transporter [Stellaceae bacterium]|jgi:FSR family fosmidomycin resistance protein-like MFS transporter|nr:MFS transporter [Stellaceae bacterium]